MNEEQYILIETEDIDLSILRKAVETFKQTQEDSNTVAFLQQEQHEI